MSARNIPLGVIASQVLAGTVESDAGGDGGGDEVDVQVQRAKTYAVTGATLGSMVVRKAKTYAVTGAAGGATKLRKAKTYVVIKV